MKENRTDRSVSKKNGRGGVKKVDRGHVAGVTNNRQGKQSTDLEVKKREPQ